MGIRSFIAAAAAVIALASPAAALTYTGSFSQGGLDIDVSVTTPLTSGGYNLFNDSNITAATFNVKGSGVGEADVVFDVLRTAAFNGVTFFVDGTKLRFFKANPATVLLPQRFMAPVTVGSTQYVLRMDNNGMVFRDNSFAFTDGDPAANYSIAGTLYQVVAAPLSSPSNPDLTEWHYGFELTAVPLPASVFLLLAGVGGLAVVGRRKAAAKAA